MSRLHLTRFGLVVVATGTLLYVASLWSPRHLETPFDLYAALVVILIFLEWRHDRIFAPSCQFELPAAVALGQGHAVRCFVSNPSSARRRFEWRWIEGPHLALDDSPQPGMLVPDQGSTVRNQVTGLALGAQRTGDLHLRVRGPFGLIDWERRFAPPKDIDVIPGRLHDRTDVPADHERGDREGDAAGHGQEFHSLREYERGDPPRAIDWKATARSGRRMIRRFTDEQQLNMFLLIDVSFPGAFDAGGLSRIARFVNAAARLAELAALRRDTVGLLCYGHEPGTLLRAGASVPHLAQIRDLLAAQRVLPEQPNHVAAFLAAQRHIGQHSLLIFMTHLDQEDQDGQLIRAVREARGRHLPLVASLRDPVVAALARNQADEWLDPYTRVASQQQQLQTDRNVLKLRRLGASVLHTDAGAFETALLHTYRQIRQRHRIS
jgi:uncharacterized protein (DUF58 family)